MTEAERIRGQHLDELTFFAEGVREAEDALNRAVERARQERISWNYIARAIGISRQGARQRWGV